MIYKFRIILDVEKDVFRDIEIQSDASLEDFHNAIVQAFNFDGKEMASFYKSNEDWEQGEEFSLFETPEASLMSQTILGEIVSKENSRLLYVYDFLNMWTFFVELIETGEVEAGVSYPNLLFAHGLVPSEAPEKNFEADFDDFDDEFNDFEFDEDEFNDYHGYSEGENDDYY